MLPASPSSGLRSCGSAFLSPCPPVCSFARARLAVGSAYLLSCLLHEAGHPGRVSQRQISCASFCRCLRILVTVYRVTMYAYNVVGVHASSSRVDSRLTAGPVCAGDFVRKRSNIAKNFFAGLCPAPRQGCCPGPACELVLQNIV